MALGIYQSAVLSFPDALAGVEANTMAVNDAGGIKGRKINLITCNDKYDPNTAADCARQAVSKKVVAVISPYEPFSPQVVPILEAAKIPYFYASLAEDIDGKSSIAFPRDAGVPDQYATLGLELAKAGCKKVGAVVNSTPNTELGAKWLERGLKSKGVAYTSASVADTQADMNAPVAKLLGEGIDCIVPATKPNQGTNMVKAVQQSGKKLQIGATSSEFGVSDLTKMGAQTDGMIMTGQEYRPSDTSVPAVAAAVAGFKKYKPDVQLTDKFGMTAWASITALQQLLDSIDGDITASSALAAAAKLSPKTGLYADFAYSDSAPVSDFPRAKNWKYLTWKVEGGKATLSTTSFIEPTGL
jgi:ABC-type branched-subunit amino acid transport system substrate-binding protein